MTENKDFSYIGYQEMIADITTALENTSEAMNQLELTRQAKQARDMATRIKSHVFSVGIMGEFKRGKSTVINALLGEEIAPADVVPASATLNRITYGMKPRATVLYKDGHHEEVPVNKIADYVTKITEDSAATAELVDQAVIEYPCQFCQNNVEIIDTPGLNDDDRMDAISEAIIPRLDAVVLVLSADSPFSKSEAEFVRNKLMTSDVTRLIVLVNRIDVIYGEENRARILKSIRAKIFKEILERTEAIHGADSKLYQDTKDKLSDIKLYPLSAIQALIGRKENRQELVQQSGILEFEERLRKLLTQERGILEIARASGLITTLLGEGENALNLRMSALEMTTEEFLRNQKEAEIKIEELRRGKKEEKGRIRHKSVEIRKQMDDFVQKKYVDLEHRVNDYLNAYPITIEELKTETKQKKLRSKVASDLEEEITKALSEYMEQINVFLQETIGDERILVQKYIGDLSDHLKSINENIRKNSVSGTACVIGIDALSNLVAATCTGILTTGGFPLMGLGGMLEGYRTAGVKGATTGLLGGFVSSALVSVAIITVFGSVPFIPFALITGASGTMGGKFISSAIWGKDIEKKKIEEIRESFKATGEEAIRDMREKRLLENWAQQQVETQIDLLIEQIEEDAEAMISSTEDTLKSIAADIVKANQNKEQCIEECHKIEKKLKNINARIIPVMEKVDIVSKQIV